MEKDWWKKFLSEDGRELHLNRTYLTSLAGVVLPENLKVLNLSGTKLTLLKGAVLPENLQELNLSGSHLTSLEGAVLPENLKALNLSGTKLTLLKGAVLPENLQELNLSGSHLTSLEGAVLPENLKVLNLSGLQMTSLKGAILPENLQFLDLSYTQLMSLESVMLPENLQKLYLRRTPLTSLEGVVMPKNLQFLDLSGSQLAILKGAVLSKNLQALDLRGTKLTSLEGVVLPENLQTLCLNGTKLTSPEGAVLPENLQMLYLNHTPLTSLPNSIKDLRNLKMLDLSKLKLKELPDWLPELGLPFTKSALGNGIRLCEATVEGVDMSIFDQSQETILEWFENRKAQPLNELKVVFLGDGGAGKSHTIARLLNDGAQTGDFPDISTPGIVIKDKPYKFVDKEVKVHFWDFGGQEILHSMHRMFLTERTLYVVMLNVRDGTQDDRARYWLYNLRSFAKGAPVLLVLNQMDMNENATLNESDLRKLYPTLAPDVVKLSTLKYSDGEFEEKFIDVLRRQIGSMDILAFPFTPSWSRLKEKLQNMEKPYIFSDDFRKFCDECGVTDSDKIRRNLLNWFSDLGVSFCYSGSASLEDYVVLRPDWITNAIYIVLFNKAETANNGQVSHEVIYKMLSSRDMEKYRRTVTKATYKPYEVDYVLKVFRKFRLSFLAEDGIEFLPMLCNANANPISTVYETDPDALEFRMYYEYLPNNVIHRLMVERRSELDLDTVWLYGGLFRNSCTGLSAVVKAEGNLLRIIVRRESSETQPQRYLNDLKINIERINEEMGLTAEKTEVVYKQGDQIAFFDYEEILVALELGNSYITSKVFRRNIPLNEILKQTAHAADGAQTKLLLMLIRACEALQNNHSFCVFSEDGRNTYIRDILRSNGYHIADQSLTGISPSGIKAGEVDMDIRREPNERWTLLEALNLSSSSASNIEYWNAHLKKLLDNYNSTGCPFLFHVTYLSCAKDAFAKHCVTFEDHMRYYSPNGFSLISERPTDPLAKRNIRHGGFLRAMECVYDCGGIPMTVYHFFVRMGE